MLPPVFTWLPLPDLPAPPEHFVDQAIHLAESRNYQDLLHQRYHGHAEYRQRQVTYQGQPYITRCQAAVSMGPEFEQWIRQNILPDFSDATLRVNAADHEGQTVQGAHVDGRMLKLIWVIEQGGSDAMTEFYQVPGQIGIIHNVQQGQRLSWTNMDELLVIDRCQFPVRSWSIHNGFVCHGMTGLTHRRLEFSVTVRPQDFYFSVHANSQHG